jgi:PST family polysaccharide transporter
MTSPTEAPQPPVPADVVPEVEDGARIARGMASMLASQVVLMPISFVTNAILARKLGPPEFGAFFFGSTVVGLGFLFVDWGQTSAVSLQVSRDRSLASPLLGTSIVVKLAVSLLTSAVLVGLGFVQGYSPLEWTAVIFSVFVALASSLQASGTAVLRGYELTEQISYVAVAGTIITSGLTIALALAGFGLRGALWASLCGGVVSVLVTAVLVRRCGVQAPSFSRAHIRMLLGQGTAFLAYNVVLAAQPYIDTALLARLAPPEVMGWHAATRRIVGLLLLPGISVGYSMYPTVARLYKEAPERANELMRVAFHRLALLGMPAMLGAILFARPVVFLIYGASYDGAVLNLQSFAPWLLLVYFSMLIGNSLFAMERVLKWTAVQALCLVVSAVADAPLITYFQGHFANGALGISASNIISEVLMVVLGAVMLPRAMLGAGVLRAVAQASVAGAAMVGVALGLTAAPTLVAAAAASVAYVVVLFALGAISRNDVQTAVRMLRMRSPLRRTE